MRKKKYKEKEWKEDKKLHIKRGNKDKEEDET